MLSITYSLISLLNAIINLSAASVTYYVTADKPTIEM